MAEHRVERLQAGDEARLDELMALFGAVFEDQATYTAARPSAGYARRLLNRDSFFALVAMDAGRVVGGLTAYELVKPEREVSEIYIYDLAVSRPHRRTGVATALIETLKAIAVDKGAWVVFVQADHGDDPAIALYTRLGTREDVMHFDILLP